MIANFRYYYHIILISWVIVVRRHLRHIQLNNNMIMSAALTI